MTSKFGAWLRLGRVSNLPTVWTNVLAALALSETALPLNGAVRLMVAMSFFYVGGMFLNDFFDREIDAKERPSRPIPMGSVSAVSVAVTGTLFLGTGGGLCVWLAAEQVGALPLRAGLSALALGACIVAYNAHHKNNPLSPLVMGLCRVCVYVTVLFAVRADWAPKVGWGALVLLAYLIGLTYAAKQEALNRIRRLWPLALLAVAPCYAVLAPRAPSVDPVAGFIVTGLLCLWLVLALRFLLVPRMRSVPSAVVRLIAGISLVDAALIATMGHTSWVALAVGGCVLTRAFQRWIPGT